MQEAQASARRELAARDAAEREAAARAAAQAAAEREAAERAAAERLAAEAAARREAERLAAEAQRRAAAWQAEREREAESRRQAEAEAAARAEAGRLEAERLDADRRERLEQERLEQARVEAERLAAERQAEPERGAEAAAAAPPPAPAVPRRAGQTLVMVADDSKVVRVKTSRLLAAHQFRVVLAEDGAQALTLIGQESPQVLITDVEMPGLDGMALTRALRADPRTAAVPVVMITSADDRLRDEAAAAGVTVLMGKPYTEQDLIVHVARLAGVSLDG